MNTVENVKQKPAWAARADRYETQARILRKSAAAAMMDREDPLKILKLLVKAMNSDIRAQTIRAAATRT